MQTSTADQIRATVREAYGAVASQNQHGGCCGGGGVELLRPDRDFVHATSATPTPISPPCPRARTSASAAAIRRRSPRSSRARRVLDLGSGGGFDAFLAARQVGPTGRVIGVDMTPEMIAQARAQRREGRRSPTSSSGSARSSTCRSPTHRST